MNSAEDNVANRKLSQYLTMILVGVLLCTPMIVLSATKADAVKAGFVYNFTKFIVWPDNARDKEKFNLCVIGDDNLNGGLEALYGKKVDGKPLVLQRKSSALDVKECQMAFIGSVKKTNLQQVLQKLKQVPVLTVSDLPGFIDKGGMLGLIRDGNRVGFEVNLDAVRAANLHMGAQLLKLAKRVRRSR